MKLVVLADRRGAELQPLTSRLATALLPVVGKPMVAHTMESLVLAGLQSAQVAVGPFSNQVRSLLGDGARWGLQLDYQLTRGERSVDACVQHVSACGVDAARTDDDVLVVRGDVMRTSLSVRTFLRAVERSTSEMLFGTTNGQSAGLWYFRAGVRLTHIDAWSDAKLMRGMEVVELPGDAAFRIGSLKEYHTVNVEVAKGNTEGVMPIGRQREEGFHAAPRAQVPRASVHGQGIVVGSSCDVHREASLGPGTVLSENIYVDRHASVQDSVVLPNTYLGEMIALEGNIAWQNQLIDVETGTATEIADAFLMGTLEPPTLGSFVGHWAHRLFALVLLVLSAPLWPVAWLGARCKRVREPTRAAAFFGNLLARDERGRIGPELVPGWEFNIDVPVLRHLPKLIPAVTGDVRLVGVSPLTPDEYHGRTEDWELVRDDAPVGLVSPSSLLLPPAAPLPDRLMADAVYVRSRSGWSDAGLVVRALAAAFTARAWTAPAAPEHASDSYQRALTGARVQTFDWNETGPQR